MRDAEQKGEGGGKEKLLTAGEAWVNNKKREEDSAAPAGGRAACLPLLGAESRAAGPQMAKHRGGGF